MAIRYDFKGSPKRDFTAAILHPEGTPMQLFSDEGCTNMLYADGTPGKPSEFDPSTWTSCGAEESGVNLFNPIALIMAIINEILCGLFGLNC